jgi:DNA-binding protein YbaB
MDLHDDTDLDHALDAVRAEIARLQETERSVAAIAVTGRSHDRTVEVDLQGYGTVAGVKISPEAMDRHDHRSLSGAIMEAVSDAVRQTFQQTAEHFPELGLADADADDQHAGPEADPHTADAAPTVAVSAWRQGATT